MKAFHFKNFSVLQDKQVFRVGTDAVLLGVLSSVEYSRNILEIGSGTGIISLMVAQRNLEAKITAIDINEEAAKLSQLNFINSIYSERLSAKNADLKKLPFKEKFDLIICNPPYFEVTPQSDKDEVARQKIHLNFTELIENSLLHLDSKGLISIIIPYESQNEFGEIATQNSLHLSKKITIFGRENIKPKRVILEFKKEKTTVDISELIIEKSPRKFSDQYLELTKDFHVFT